MIRNLVIAVLIIFYYRSDAQKLKLAERLTVHLKKNLSFRLKIPEGYNISIAAEGLASTAIFCLEPGWEIVCY